MSWFKNLTLFKLTDDIALTKEILTECLSKQLFTENVKSCTDVKGWVSPFKNTELVHDLNGHYFFGLKHESKILPSSVVKEHVEAKSIEIEDQQGYKPGRKQLKEIKEAIVDELLPKAFTKSKITRVWIDKHNKYVFIDSATASVVDDIIGLMSKSFDPLPIKSLHTEQSPTVAMTDWLIADEAPHNFTIDADTLLQSTADNSKIKYVNLMPASDEINLHVSAGKQCTMLALTWADRISFILDTELKVKKLRPLDILKESVDKSGPDELERLDADLTLMTEEVAQLISDLVTGLGGIKKIDQ